MAAHANLGTGRPAEQDYGFLRPAKKQPIAGPKPLTQTDVNFLSRMDGDVDERRRTSFIIELKKDPRFKPSMLEPPRAKFKTVTLDGGPIIKSHKNQKTGLETARPYKWGPLGGWY